MQMSGRGLLQSRSYFKATQDLVVVVVEYQTLLLNRRSAAMSPIDF